MPDPLTGVLRRFDFLTMLQEAYERQRTQQSPPGWLLAIALDRLKRFNDVYGLAAGDALLVKVARALEEAIPPDCPIGRLGGDEFAVWCPRGTLESMSALGERLRGAIARLRFEREHALTLTYPEDGALRLAAGEFTASVGITATQPDDPCWNAILRRTGHALHEAKAMGRNQVRLALASPFPPDEPPTWTRGDGRRSPIPAMIPFGPTMRTLWVSSGESGQGELAVAAAGVAPIVIEWTLYGYASRRAYLGRFLHEGRRLALDESFLDIDMGNSGTIQRHAEVMDPSGSGCCTLLVEALLAGKPPLLSPGDGPGCWRLECSSYESGAIYNTVVYTSQRLKMDFDLSLGTVRLSTVAYCDTST